MIGQTISHYQITAKLGAGGMGEVFLAEDTSLQRKVALKFLPQHFSADTDARARFKREAQALAAFNHPNIVTVYEVADHEGRPYIAMEYVEGRSIKELVASEEPDIESILDIASQIGRGLAAAHKADIVHRDIKSENIVVTADGQVKIMDFGLATWRGAAQVTEDGSTVGTASYMPPEQVQGRKIDNRSDLWSFGVVLYEMLTRHLPFAGDHHAAIAYAIVQETPPPLSRYMSDVPPVLQDIINRALDKDPETRYQSAAEMVADLKRLRKVTDSSGAISATGISAVTPPRPRRRRGMIISATLVTVAILAILIFQPWKIEISPSHQAQAQQNRLAIMYFDNIVDPADEDRQGEIVTNLLISDLSGSKAVEVVSSQHLYDILKLLGKEGVKTVDRETATEVAQKTDARWMLTGSILRLEPAIVITAQLVDVESGAVISSPRIDGMPDEDLFAIVDRLTDAIKSDLSLPTAVDEENRAIADMTTHSAEAYRHYLEGWEACNRMQDRQAADHFQRAIAADSTFAMAYYGLSFVAPGTEAKFEAIRNAKRWSDKLGKADRLRIRSQEALGNERYEEAMALLEEIVAEDPNDKLAYAHLASLWNNWPMRDNEKAKRYFLKVIDLDPLYKLAYNSLAYLYSRVGNPDSAIWAINKYIEIAPDEPNPYDSRAELYGFSGRIDEAIASYRRALELDSTYAASQKGLVRMYVYSGDYAAAERILQRRAAYERRGTRSGARWDRVDVALYRGQLAEALRRARVAFETDRIEYGEELWSWWRHDHMATVFATTAELTGDDRWHDSVRAQIEKTNTALAAADDVSENTLATLYGEQAGSFALIGDTARADSQMALVLENTDTTVYGERMDYRLRQALVQFYRGNYESALNYTSDVLHIERHFVVYAHAGRLHLLAGQPAQAVDLLERAATRYDQSRLGPNLGYSARVHYWLGQAYEASGWNEKAIEQYETFLEIWKDADEGIIDIEDARSRLERLQT